MTTPISYEEQMYVCRNCLRMLEQHADGRQCLFAPTKFESMTSREYMAYLTTTAVLGEIRLAARKKLNDP